MLGFTQTFALSRFVSYVTLISYIGYAPQMYIIIRLAYLLPSDAFEC